jgi:hypothetical protein
MSCSKHVEIKKEKREKKEEQEKTWLLRKPSYKVSHKSFQ